MKLEWRGAGELSKKLRSNIELDLAKKIVKVNSAELDTKMKQNALFKGHMEMRGGKKIFVKPTGQTKRSINTELSNGGLTSTTKPGTEYAPYLEYGTRFMSSQPFVAPSFNVQKEKFKSDMDRLV